MNAKKKGGSLTVRGKDNRWRLVGITSWGFGEMGTSFILI